MGWAVLKSIEDWAQIGLDMPIIFEIEHVITQPEHTELFE
jgi:hypothetical protein